MHVQTDPLGIRRSDRLREVDSGMKKWLPIPAPGQRCHEGIEVPGHPSVPLVGKDLRVEQNATFGRDSQ